MITILAEKPDVGNKIAAALDGITLSGGKKVDFKTLRNNKSVEKTVKAQQAKDGFLKIRYMGQDCYVTWAYGHLGSLKQAVDYNSAYKYWASIPMPFIPARYELTVKSSPDKAWNDKIQKQFMLVKKLFNQSDLIINATDFDREGEVIFAYIYELARCTKPVKRACFSSQTEEGIKEGFGKNAKTSSEVQPIEIAGRMRGIADWVVGANLTVAMTLKNRGQGVFSVGRVQTPTLAIIVKREKEIAAFSSKPYYVLQATFKTDKGEEFKAELSGDRIENRADAESTLLCVDGAPGTVVEFTGKKVKKEVPQLFSLSALQMECSSELSLTADQVLEIAQKLYDEGYTTYPRTNSRFLTEDMVPVIDELLEKLKAVPDYSPLIEGRPKTYNKPNYFDDKKVESHFAIIPTGNIPTGLTEKQQSVYDLICRSVIMMLYREATLEQTQALIEAEGLIFKAKGNVVADKGWMAVSKPKKKDELLPRLSVDEVVEGTYEILDKKTKPPKRYTDGTLIAKMLAAGKDLDDAALAKILSDPKTGGIGTEATRAAIIKTLVDRGYITRDKKAIIATEKGISLIDKLPLEQIKSAEMTAKWEQRLNDIARSKEDATRFRTDIEAAVKEWVLEIADKVELTTHPTGTLAAMCPLCGSPMRTCSWGYGCSGYKDGCKFTVGEICGRKIKENELIQLLNEGETKELKGFKSKAGKSFSAKLKMDAGKITFVFSSPLQTPNKNKKAPTLNQV